MAFGVPVAATEIFGLPELLTDGRTGWLFRERDLESLTAVLARILSTPVDERRAIGDAASQQVHRNHDSLGYAEDYFTLLDALRRDPATQPGDVLAARWTKSGHMVGTDGRDG